METETCLCTKCSGLCCRYFALPLDNPKTAKQYDDIRWYLAHENIVIFIEKKQWYIGILNRCKHLQDDNRCGIYNNRPDICRKYSTDNCDYHGGEYDFDVLFTSAEQLRIYAVDKLTRQGKWKPGKNNVLLRAPAAPVNDDDPRASGGDGAVKKIKGRPLLALPVLRA